MTEEERQRVDAHLRDIATKVLELTALVGDLQDELHIQGLGGLPETAVRYFETGLQPLTLEQARQLEPLAQDLASAAGALDHMAWLGAVLAGIERSRAAEREQDSGLGREL